MKLSSEALKGQQRYGSSALWDEAFDEIRERLIKIGTPVIDEVNDYMFNVPRAEIELRKQAPVPEFDATLSSNDTNLEDMIEIKVNGFYEMKQTLPHCECGAAACGFKDAGPSHYSYCPLYRNAD
jgi:hypothetical protein